MNVYCRDETVETSTIYSETPAIYGVYTCAQLFVCTKSLVSSVYAMKTAKQCVNTLEGNIHDRGAMS